MLADALVIPIDFRFTRSLEPVYLNFGADDSTMLFVLATHTVRGAGTDDADLQPRARPQNGNISQQHGRRLASGVAQPVKRGRPGEDGDAGSRAESEISAPGPCRPRFGTRPQRIESSRSPTELDLASTIASRALVDDHGGAAHDSLTDEIPPPSQSQPLFLASQLSQRDMDAIRESGLGIEDMDAEQFAEMLDCEGEEINFGLTPPRAESTTILNGKLTQADATLEDELEFDDISEMDMGPTQRRTTTENYSEKASISIVKRICELRR